MPESPILSRTHKPAAWGQRAFAWSLHAGNRLMRGVAPERKDRLFRMLSGRVLEIGPGAGANLPLYPRDTTLFGIDPNRFMFRYLREEAREAARTMHLLNGRAESLCLSDNAIDAVVCTHVLCSVDDLDAALREILRVLKPGGLFVFFEHVVALRATPPFPQRLLRPGWQSGRGCCPDRELWRALNGRFLALDLRAFPRAMRRLPSAPPAGWARKPGGAG